MDLLILLFLSPIFVGPLSVLYFVSEVVRRKLRVRETIGGFVAAVILWCTASLGIAIAYVIGFTIAHDSPQGPLALIFYGPLAISVGFVAATIAWRRKETKRSAPSAAPKPSASHAPYTSSDTPRS